MHFQVGEDKDKIISLLSNIEKSLENKPALNLNAFEKEKTLIVFVDVINGFIGEGVYSNPLAKGIFESVKCLAENPQGISAVAFADAHTEKSLEFEAHPVHALAGTAESELHLEIKDKVIRTFYKDSINGFFAEGFQDYLDVHKEIENVIVAGLVTDICVLNFCLTLKSYCNQTQRKLDIHVPTEAVESFELENVHNATLMNLVSASMLESNGIKIYKNIK